MNKTRWVTTECECRMEYKDGSLIWITVYLNNLTGWHYMMPGMMAGMKSSGFKTITKAKQAAIEAFKKMESEE